jgi:hypothetical protein
MSIKSKKGRRWLDSDTQYVKQAPTDPWVRSNSIYEKSEDGSWIPIVEDLYSFEVGTYDSSFYNNIATSDNGNSYYIKVNEKIIVDGKENHDNDRNATFFRGFNLFHFNKEFELVRSLNTDLGSNHRNTIDVYDFVNKTPDNELVIGLILEDVNVASKIRLHREMTYYLKQHFGICSELENIQDAGSFIFAARKNGKKYADNLPSLSGANGIGLSTGVQRVVFNAWKDDYLEEQYPSAMTGFTDQSSLAFHASYDWDLRDHTGKNKLTLAKSHVVRPRQIEFTANSSHLQYVPKNPDEHNLDFSSNGFTVSLWIRKRSRRQDADNEFGVNIISQALDPDVNPSRYFWELKMSRTGGGYTVNLLSYPSGSIITSEVTAWEDHQFHHLVVTVDNAGTVFIYVDNVQVGTGSVTPIDYSVYQQHHPILLGKNDLQDLTSIENQEQVLKEVRIYNRVLNTQEQTALFQVEDQFDTVVPLYNREPRFDLTYGVKPWNPGYSGLDILRNNPSTLGKSGVYWIYRKTNYGLTADERTKVFCDMETDGGGWVLVMNNSPYSPAGATKPEYAVPFAKATVGETSQLETQTGQNLGIRTSKAGSNVDNENIPNVWDSNRDYVDNGLDNFNMFCFLDFWNQIITEERDGNYASHLSEYEGEMLYQWSPGRNQTPYQSSIMEIRPFDNGDEYRLNIRGNRVPVGRDYPGSGTEVNPDILTYSNGMQLSTVDNDNDNLGGTHLAVDNGTLWWYDTDQRGSIYGRGDNFADGSDGAAWVGIPSGPASNYQHSGGGFGSIFVRRNPKLFYEFDSDRTKRNNIELIPVKHPLVSQYEHGGDTIDQGLLAWYPFKRNNLDYSGNERHLSKVLSNVHDRNQRAIFDNSEIYAMKAPIDWGQSGDFEFSFSLHFQAVTIDTILDAIFAIGENGISQKITFQLSSDGDLEISYQDNNVQYQVSVAEMTNPKGIHIAYNHRPHSSGLSFSQRRELYINGKKVSPIAIGLDADGPMNMAQNTFIFFGGRRFTTSTYYDGYLWDYRLYNRILTEKEIGSLYRAERYVKNVTPKGLANLTVERDLTGYDEGLHAHFPFNGSSINVITGSPASITQNDGVFVIDPDVSGRQVLEFNGPNQVINFIGTQASDLNPLSQNEKSFSFWVKTNWVAEANDNCVIGWHTLPTTITEGTGFAYGLGGGNASNYIFHQGTAYRGDYWENGAFVNPLADGQWHHITLIRGFSYATIPPNSQVYIDGRIIRMRRASDGLVQSYLNTLNMDNSLEFFFNSINLNSSEFYRIRDLKIFKRRLDQAEVGLHYEMSKANYNNSNDTVVEGIKKRITTYPQDQTTFETATDGNIVYYHPLHTGAIDELNLINNTGTQLISLNVIGYYDPEMGQVSKFKSNAASRIIFNHLSFYSTFTISLSIKINEDDTGVILSFNNLFNKNNLQLYYNGDQNRLFFYASSSNGNSNTVSDSAFLEKVNLDFDGSREQRITITYDGTDFRLYIENILSEVVRLTPYSLTLSTPLWLGTDATNFGGASFLAKDFYMFDRALTESEVVHLWAKHKHTLRIVSPLQNITQYSENLLPSPTSILGVTEDNPIRNRKTFVQDSGNNNNGFYWIQDPEDRVPHKEYLVNDRFGGGWKPFCIFGYNSHNTYAIDQDRLQQGLKMLITTRSAVSNPTTSAQLQSIVNFNITAAQDYVVWENAVAFEDTGGGNSTNPKVTAPEPIRNDRS